MKLTIAAKKVAILFMVLALGVAMIACQGAAGVAGEPGKPGQPGEPGKAAPQPPFIALEIPDISELVQEMSKTVDLSEAFGDPEGKDLVFSAKSGDSTIATVAVSGSTLTVTGVKVGATSVTATATDPDKLSRSQSFKVTVTAAPPKPVTIEDVKTKYPTLSIEPTTAAAASKEIELPADHTLISENTAVVKVAAKTAADTPASSIRWASATADTAAKNVWVVTAVAMGVTNVDVLDKSGDSVHSIRVTVTADPPVTEPDPADAAVAAKGTIPGQSAMVKKTATVTLADYFEVGKNNEPLTYEAVSATMTVATVAEASGVLTITGVAVGTSEITVTATDAGENTATQTFTATVTANPADAAVAAKGTIPGQSAMVKKTATVTLADYFEVGKNNEPLTYEAVSATMTVATVAEASGVLTITGVAAGTSEITVTATDAGKETATQTFTATVTANPLYHVFTGTDPWTIDLADYLPETADPATYHMEQSDASVVSVARKDGISDDEWVITPKSHGSSDVDIIVTSTGKTAVEIEVVVENRAPITKKGVSSTALTEDLEAVDSLTTLENKNGGPLEAYKAVLDVFSYFDDPDEADQAGLMFDIRSGHSDVVVIREKNDCQWAEDQCSVVVAFKRELQNVSSFNLEVRAKDKGGLLSPRITFPFDSNSPAPQKYRATQSNSARFRPITVGERKGVKHELKFHDRFEDDLTGTAFDAPGRSLLAFIAKLKADKTGYEAADATSILGLLQEKKVFASASAGTLVWQSDAFDGKKPKVVTGGNATALGHATIVVSHTGAVSDVSSGGTTVMSLGYDFQTTKPESTIMFEVGRIGQGTIKFTLYLYADKDGVTTGDGADGDQDWYVAASETLIVNVVRIP